MKVDVFLKDGTLWLTQKALAKLFGIQAQGINKHLKNIFESGELEESSVISILETTAPDGKNYQIRYYNLDLKSQSHATQEEEPRFRNRDNPSQKALAPQMPATTKATPRSSTKPSPSDPFSSVIFVSPVVKNSSCLAGGQGPSLRRSIPASFPRRSFPHIHGHNRFSQSPIAMGMKTTGSRRSARQCKRFGRSPVYLCRECRRGVSDRLVSVLRGSFPVLKYRY